MIHASLIWPPYPYRAGFTLTDDTDAATLSQVKAVYDFLLEHNFRTTKTVWPFLPSEKCGNPATPDSTLRGITLQDEQYLEYCRMLAGKGFEICLHGASAGNNTREQTKKALDFLAENIAPSDTFICHSKNADNMYWEEKITSLFPFTYLLKWFSKHECSGEIPSSVYFWGDYCREHINQIRLYRTLHVNTLKRNPSMPYFCPERPYVNSWFSATKRPLFYCAQQEKLDQLIAENGLTVLYQYAHRYAHPDTGVLDTKFMRAVETITSNSAILVAPVSETVGRLRLIQGIFCFYEGTSVWVLNTNTVAVRSLQILLDRETTATADGIAINVVGKTVVLAELPALAMLHISTGEAVNIRGKQNFARRGRERLCQKLPHATLYVNFSATEWEVAGIASLRPHTFYLEAMRSGTGHALLSFLPVREELQLIGDQFRIIAREILLKGRSLSSSKYLDASKEILLENHDNW